MPNLDKKFLQDTFLLYGDETVNLMHMALLILDDKDSQAIFSEIVKVYRKEKNQGKSSNASSALLDILQSGKSCQDKWNALVAYCENRQNKYITLAFVISETVPSLLPQIVFNKGKAIEDEDLKQAHQYYKQATTLAKKFDKDLVSDFNTHIHRTAQKALNMGAYNSSYSSVLSAESSVHRHRAALLGKSVKKIAGCATGSAVLVAGHIDLFTGVLALPVGMATGVISTLVGAAHGFFRMATRELLNTEQLDILFNDLNQMSARDDAQKQHVIIQIVQEYTKTRSENCSSDSSNKLFETLKAGDKSVSHKWNDLIDYMTERFNNSSLLKSNGKRLFRSINNIITDYLKAQPQSKLIVPVSALVI